MQALKGNEVPPKERLPVFGPTAMAERLNHIEEQSTAFSLGSGFGKIFRSPDAQISCSEAQAGNASGCGGGIVEGETAAGLTTERTNAAAG